MIWCQTCMFVHDPAAPCGAAPAGDGLKKIERRGVPTQRHQILVRLDSQTIDAIRADSRYREGGPGREGGIARWLRERAHEALGLAVPPDLHEIQSAERKGRPRQKPPASE